MLIVDTHVPMFTTCGFTAVTCVDGAARHMARTRRLHRRRGASNANEKKKKRAVGTWRVPLPPASNCSPDVLVGGCFRGHSVAIADATDAGPRFDHRTKIGREKVALLRPA